ncbi:MAG: helix-turn-helix transcriptional regulator [Chloroflexota bacterium]|nr:helix-turn-helix transcriptional regulator [Chloroflexota bacterium]
MSFLDHLTNVILPNLDLDPELKDCPECGAAYCIPGFRVGPSVIGFTSQQFQAICLSCWYKTQSARTQKGAIGNWNGDHTENRLFDLRISKSLTQKQLAEMAGLSQNTIHLVETNQSKPTRATRRKIAKALQVDINAF